MRFYIVGGDARIEKAGRMLKADGCVIKGRTDEAFDADASMAADALLCGVPMSSDGHHLYAPLFKNPLDIDIIADALRPGQMLFAGKIPPEYRRTLKEKGVWVMDVTESESFQIKNARLTAEGAVYMALKEMKRSIFRSKIGVIGYGRIGKMLSLRLRALGSDVTVFTQKKENIPWIEDNKMNGAPLGKLSEHMAELDALFNTAPAPVFGKEDLLRTRSDCLLVELASLPGGFYDLPPGRVTLGLALPGKTAPESAGEVIYETIKEGLKEKGVLL